MNPQVNKAVGELIKARKRIAELEADAKNLIKAHDEMHQQAQKRITELEAQLKAVLPMAKERANQFPVTAHNLEIIRKVKAAIGEGDG